MKNQGFDKFSPKYKEYSAESLGSGESLQQFEKHVCWMCALNQELSCWIEMAGCSMISNALQRREAKADTIQMSLLAEQYYFTHSW